MESSDALDALGRVPYTPGTTNTAEALWMAREQMFKAERGERADRRNVIVLITDGGKLQYNNTTTHNHATYVLLGLRLGLGRFRPISYYSYSTYVFFNSLMPILAASNFRQ